METLLPSEISRLVLGYLEEQCCSAAAQTFLESCPHLKECSEASQRGRRFSTRVSGRTLNDILDEYCLIYTLVQDRIQKLPENAASQLRHSCGTSLADQVKQLIDGKVTGQRFHVNITVPTQVSVPQSNITSLGGLISNSSHHGHQRSKSRVLGSSVTHAPSSSQHLVTPTSSRIRRSSHHLQEQRLTLRSQDPLEDVTASVTVQRIEATQLESLPGSIGSPALDMGCHPIRRISQSGEKNHTGNSENVTFDHEEGNSSLHDPKMRELSSLSDVSHSVQTSNVNDSSSAKEGDAQHSSVDKVGDSSLVVQNIPPKTFCGEQSVVGGRMSSANTSGRSSLDNLMIDILSTHEVRENTQYHNKGLNSASHPSAESAARHEGSSVTHSKDSSNTAETRTEQSAASTSGISSQDSERIHSGALNSPNQRDKGIHDAYLSTPRRSGAKRKTKPTPLKMITPLKHKTGSDSSDSGEVVVDPKLFFGPLLDNRQLHEKIAENINQFIRSSGGEAGSELSEMHTPEAVVAPPAPSSTGEAVMHQELEKAIKTVVDKTEADPLFERLLTEILGPEYEDDCSSIIMPPSPEDKISQGESSGGDQATNSTKPSDHEKKDPLALLEDQNEAAIKSILEAQPLVEDVPNPKRGKTVLTRGGLCKNRGFSRNNSVKVVRCKPSGACNPIFAEPEITGKSSGKVHEGAITSSSNENTQANGQDANKLIILPFSDMVRQPLSLPTIIINGVPQCMVPITPSQAVPQKLKPIVSKDDRNDVPGTQQFLLRKVTPEELKSLIGKSTVGPIGTPQVMPLLDSSLGPLVLQNSMHVAESIRSADELVESSNDNRGLPSLIDSDSGVGVHVNKSTLPQETQGGTSDVSGESKSQVVEEQGTNSETGSTPNVVGSRPGRAATEGRLPILEAPRATPLMPAGNRRASLSTPRRNRASGHVRALDFGSTPPKQLEAGDSCTRTLSKSMPDAIPGTSGLQNEMQVMIRKQLAPSKIMRKDLVKTVDPMPPYQPPDPTTCIATRSPPPQLSGAWNKVGVDLIFGGGASPNDPVSSPTLHSNLNLDNEASANGNELPGNQKENNITSSLFKWDSPKLRLKSAWDADLRAVISTSQEKPKLTKKRQRTTSRKTKTIQKTEEIATSAVTSKKMKAAKSPNESPQEAAEEIEKLPAKGKRNRKSVGKEENKKSLAKGKQQRKRVDGQEDERPSSKEKQNLNAEDAEEGERPLVKEKRKRNSVGEGGKKKAATRQKKSLETAIPVTETGDSPISPEKIWVVQQSPGSWANKRSLHEIVPNQNPVDSEIGKWPTVLGAARRRLDLQETPRKTDFSEGSDGGILSNDLGHKQLIACDRSTLTVVETPLFPPTPSINGIRTPPGQDSSEAVEIFPSYFKPREKEGVTTTGKECESETQPKDSAGTPLLGNSVDEPTSSLGDDGPSERQKEAVGSGEVGQEENDGCTTAVAQENTRRKSKSGGKKKGRNSRVRKRAVRKRPVAKQKKSLENVRQEMKRVVDGISEAQENEVTEKNAEEEDERPLTRVLRPRKRQTIYQEEPSENEKKGLYEKESLKEWNTESSPPSRRKSVRLVKANIEAHKCSTVAVEEIEEGLVFEPLAPEEVNAQTHEAEILAKEIPLKLSPVVKKSTLMEEEEESDENTSDMSGPLTKNFHRRYGYNSSGPITRHYVSSSSSSSSSSGSSSSDSSSSDSSSDDDDDTNIRPSDVSVNTAVDAQNKPMESDKNVNKACEDVVVRSENVCENLNDLEREGIVRTEDTDTVVKSGDSKRPDIEKANSGREEEREQLLEKEDIGSKEDNEEESVRLEEDENTELNKKIEMAKSKEVSNKGCRISIGDKRRRDNLEKILFGNKDRELEEESETLEVGAGGIPSLLVNLSIVDHRLSSELEIKRQRTLERLKGGKIGRKPGVGRRVGVNQPHHPSSSVVHSVQPDNPAVHSNTSPEYLAGKIKSKASPGHTRKEVLLKEQTPSSALFDDDDDCPTLRLSEGEELEFRSPNKSIVSSPCRFDLLNSLEEKLALLHGDTSTPIMKRTARMSCTPAALHLAEHTQEKEHLGIAESEPMTSNIRTVEINFRKMEKEHLHKAEPEPMPSTSRAAELMLKVSERKYLRQLESIPSTSKAAGVKSRTKTGLKQMGLKSAVAAEKPKPIRLLRSNQSEATNEDKVNNVPNDGNTLSGEKKCGSRFQKKSIPTENDNNSSQVLRGQKQISDTLEEGVGEAATDSSGGDCSKISRRPSRSKTPVGRTSQGTSKVSQNQLSNSDEDGLDTVSNEGEKMRRGKSQTRLGKAKDTSEVSHKSPSNTNEEGTSSPDLPDTVSSEGEKVKRGRGRPRLSKSLCDKSSEVSLNQMSNFNEEELTGSADVESTESHEMGKEKSCKRPSRSRTRAGKSLQGADEENQNQMSNMDEEEMNLEDAPTNKGGKKSSEQQPNCSWTRSVANQKQLSNSNKDGVNLVVDKHTKPTVSCEQLSGSSGTTSSQGTSEVIKNQTSNSSEEGVSLTNVCSTEQSEQVNAKNCRQQTTGSRIQTSVSSEGNPVVNQNQIPNSNMDVVRLIDSAEPCGGEIDKICRQLHSSSDGKSSENVTESNESRKAREDRGCLADIQKGGENYEAYVQNTSHSKSIAQKSSQVTKVKKSDNHERNKNTVITQEKNVTVRCKSKGQKERNTVRDDFAEVLQPETSKNINNKVPSTNASDENLGNTTGHTTETTYLEIHREQEGSRHVWPLQGEVSFSTNEAYISIVYDENTPKVDTRSQSQLPLLLNGISVQLDDHEVTFTQSPYIELFSFVSLEKIGEDSVESCASSTDFSIKQKVTSKQKVSSKHKNDRVVKQNPSTKTNLSLGDRKRKYVGMSRPGENESTIKLSKDMAKKGMSKDNLSHARVTSEEDISSIQKVVETCNDASNDGANVDDDSLMTFAAIGCVGSEETHAREDEDSERFLPLKKRRTTTEDTPVKFQGDGDGANNNPGMFFQLNGMEIEDFLSKVHGDGS